MGNRILKFVVLSIMLLLLSGNTATFKSQYKEDKYSIWSETVQDSFKIYISYSKSNFSEKSEVNYYLDADLKSGNCIRNNLKGYFNKPKNIIYVGIAHFGDYHIKRRRDFIPPPFDSSGYQNKNFGHAEKFYAFLTKELMPKIEKKYNTKSPNKLIGHSLGGLFSIYG